MQTEILAGNKGIGRAVELLAVGEVVGLPTETVYGLAADALNPTAVAKIFEAKERPRFDPLIVHLPHQEWLERVADIPTQDQELAKCLTKQYWPGPLTLVLPRREIVPDIVTAGLDTVAVRLSAHPVFSQIVEALDRPLAAPSANRFGRVSPTTAQHVFEELHGRIPLIVDGAACQHGIESTIVGVSHGRIQVLRRGPITREQLSEIAPVETAVGSKIIAPGQLPSHYSPDKPLILIDDADDFAAPSGRRCGLLAWKTSSSPKFAAVRRLSDTQDFREAAANLFRYLRELDASPDVDLIVAERVPDQGLGAAIMDRLRRAATPADTPPLPQ